MELVSESSSVFKQKLNEMIRHGSTAVFKKRTHS